MSSAEPSAATTSAPAATPSQDGHQQPVAVVCVGMAGSGKTTFMQRINAHLHGQKEPPYVINLDPAVLNVPFESNIDIRDSVNYKEVMKQYNLGPNGGIITSLNLFATKVDQILGFLEKRTAPPSKEEEEAEATTKTSAGKAKKQQIKNILVDTPGQIEVFVWSASGQIILESLASSFPTVIAYVIDTPRTASTSTFMSNMLYACSILYKTKLPMILVFNKTDVKSADFAKEWMTDYDAFQKALSEDEESNAFGGVEGEGGGSGYMSSLLNSMSLVLEEFYAHLSVVGVSSMTGEGVDDFFAAVQEKAKEFKKDYLPELERKRAERDEQKKKVREKELDKMMKGMSMDGAGSSASATGPFAPIKAPAEDDEDDADVPSDDQEDDYADVDDEYDREGLQARYAAAAEAQGDSMMDQASFAKFIHSQKQG